MCKNCWNENKGENKIDNIQNQKNNNKSISNNNEQYKNDL